MEMKNDTPETLAVVCGAADDLRRFQVRHLGHGLMHVEHPAEGTVTLRCACGATQDFRSIA